MEAKTWHDLLPEEDIKLLEDVEVMTNNLIGQVYVFIDLLQQYNQLVEQSSIFATDLEENKNDDMSDGPTQTPAPANRAERRAKKTPFDVAKEKKNV
jgi:hypothetical protein